MRERWLTALAWTAHFYTALGAVASLFALFAVAEGRALETFIWLGVALFIDGTDGLLARYANVSQRAPNFNGRKLDDIIDYLNYVFIPMFFAYRFELVTGYGIAALALVVLASAYGFCQEAAKTNDGFFTGFPSDWNIVVFYMYLVRTSPEFNALFLIVLAILVFIPLKYIYPTQAPRYRRFNVVFAFVWSAQVIGLLFMFENPNPIWLYASLIYPAYYMLASFAVNLPNHSVRQDAKKNFPPL